MAKSQSFSSRCLFCVCFLFLLIRGIESEVPQFQCKKASDAELPKMPKAGTFSIRINYQSEQNDYSKSVEIRRVYDSDGQREALDVWSGKKHTKYILFRQDDVRLVIDYVADAHPLCTVSKIPKTGESVYEKNDKEAAILYKIALAIRKGEGFKDLNTDRVDSVWGRQYEACFDDPEASNRLKLRLTFANPDLIHSHLEKDDTTWEPIKIEARAYDPKMEITGNYYGFDITFPDISEFQPPEDVHCEGFRSDVKPPALPQYFTYQSEIVVYESAEGIAPIVSHRTVYYDYPSGLTRIDFQDALADNRDMFSPVTAQLKSIIHDFSSGVQYSFDPITGACKVDKFLATFDVMSAKVTVDNVMLDTRQFFNIEGINLSYKGQYSTRGLKSRVFSGAVKTDKGTSIFDWYFTTKMTQFVENGHIEENVLIRMLSRPETSEGDYHQVEINFYNFIQEEPSAFVYDLTSCYDESQSKIMVITFPEHERLRGLENIIKGTMQQALKEAAGVSMQRVYVKEVSFKKPFIYVEFTLLGLPPVFGKSDEKAPKKPTLDEAVANLKKSVDSDEFKITIRTNDSDIVLKPERGGLNDYSGDRSKPQADTGYKEGGVVGLAIGMLLLGVLLGAVIINLIISKKFGVSLFQKSKYGNNPFDNPLNESSM